jgi:hypothetical protein
VDRAAQAIELMERAEKLGIRLEFRAGFFVAVKRPGTGDPRQDEIIAELVKYVSEVRLLVERREIAAGAKGLAGQRALFHDGNNLLPGGVSVLSGVVVGTSDNGLVEVSAEKEGWRRPQTSTADPKSLLIVVDDEEADGSSSPQNDEAKAEQPRRGILERLRGSRE